MALICFWSRRACSQHIVQDSPVPPASRIGRHLAQCAECREYLSSLRLISSDLSTLIAVPHPTATFAEPVWERVKPAPKPAPSGKLALATAAACGLACGWIAWRLTTQPPALEAPQISIRYMVKPITPNVLESSVEPGPAPRQGKPVAALPVPMNRGRGLRWSHVRGDGRYRRLAVRRPWRGNIRPPAPQPRMLPPDLKASGLYLESQGDPGLANAAYQAEYERHPSEESAFDMGRSAEESGDMEQAMNVYAGLLESAATRSRPQKGSTP